LYFCDFLFDPRSTGFDQGRHLLLFGVKPFSEFGVPTGLGFVEGLCLLSGYLVD
jgi:hypothetical protein